MGKVKIINSTFELALRFLAIMRICTYPLSEYRLRAYSYLCIHLSDIEDSSTDIHPALPYRSSLFMATQEILHPALHILLTRVFSLMFQITSFKTPENLIKTRA